MKITRHLANRRLIYLYDLLSQLVERELKLLYKRSVLGIAWSLISPLLQLLVFYFVFRSALTINIPNYSSFVFCGLLVWTWFQNSLVQASGIIIASPSLIQQPGFPTAILPIVVVMTGMIHFLLTFPILIVFLLIDGIQLKPVILELPILILLQFCFTVGLGYLLAAANVTFRDIKHIISVLLQMFFYLTPIFYDISNVPGNFQKFYYLNPLVHIVTAYRNIIIDGTQPNWFALLGVSLITGIMLVLGYVYFLHQSDRFVEEL
jgi:lipopolysaccharide transport system permease protein